MIKTHFNLIDAERTEANDKLTYWKNGGRGYTTNEKEAGLYSYEEAIRYCREDIRNTTIMKVSELEEELQEDRVLLFKVYKIKGDKIVKSYGSFVNGKDECEDFEKRLNNINQDSVIETSIECLDFIMNKYNKFIGSEQK